LNTWLISLAARLLCCAQSCSRRAYDPTFAAMPAWKFIASAIAEATSAANRANFAS
jgi:hypothetical protein